MSSAHTDFLKLDSLLSSEEIQIRDSVRAFVANRVKPVIGECFEEGRFPLDIVPEMASLGLFGATLPEEYGGAGVNSVGYGLMCQELEGGDSGVRSFVSVQSSLSMYAIFQFGSEAQRRKYLPRMAKAEILGCFGLTEPNSGSDPGSMSTRAVRTKDGWVLNGSKAWITNGSVADIAIVWAKTDDNDRIRGFIVEKGTRGFSAPPLHHKMSLRASITSQLFFEDCFVPEDQVLPLSGGLKSPLMCLSQARFGIVWGALGAAMSCYETALGYATDRIQFGRPIGQFQLTQEKLVRMLTEITKGQLLALRLGRMKDAGEIEPAHISMGKVNNVAIARECAQSARSILGANGIMAEYPIMRHMCNLESVYTYEGTNEVHLLVLGQYITGLNAFGT